MLHNFDDKRANLKTLIHSIGAKEVDCHVRLTIHALNNVSLGQGRFKVRWKFRDIDSKAAKTRERAREKQSTIAGALPGIAHTIPKPPLHPSSTLKAAGSAPFADGPIQRTDDPKPIEYSGDERGQTSFIKLNRDHAVIFDHTVDVVARMRIVKGELVGEPLKLVVEQGAPLDDPDRRYEPRLGHTYVNLAEYVNEGKVRRKFLLERCKMNAMLLISMEITTLSSGTEFTKPTLRQDSTLLGLTENRNRLPPPRRPPLLRDSDTSGSRASTKSGSINEPSIKSYEEIMLERQAVIDAIFTTPPQGSEAVPVQVPPRRNTRAETVNYSSSDDSDEDDSAPRPVTRRPKYVHAPASGLSWELIPPQRGMVPKRSRTGDSFTSTATTATTGSSTSSHGATGLVMAASATPSANDGPTPPVNPTVTVPVPSIAIDNAPNDQQVDPSPTTPGADPKGGWFHRFKRSATLKVGIDKARGSTETVREESDLVKPPNIPAVRVSS